MYVIKPKIIIKITHPKDKKKNDIDDVKKTRAQQKRKKRFVHVSLRVKEMISAPRRVCVCVCIFSVYPTSRKQKRMLVAQKNLVFPLKLGGYVFSND